MQAMICDFPILRIVTEGFSPLKIELADDRPELEGRFDKPDCRRICRVKIEIGVITAVRG